MPISISQSVARVLRKRLLERRRVKISNLGLYDPPTPIDFSAPYGVSARDYFNRSYKLFPDSAKNRTLLIYCALELRIAIERTLSEYLTVVSSKEGPRSRENLYSAKDLKAAILKVEPDFIVKLKFVHLVYEAHGLGKYQLAIPELDLISTYYAFLNEHLHLPKLANTKDQLGTWEELYLLIDEIHDKLWPFVAEPRMKMDFNDAALALLDDFKSGRKSAREILKLLRDDSGDKSFKVETVLRNF